MFALVAVDEDGMIASVEDDRERSTYDVFRDVYKWFLFGMEMF